MDGNGDESDGGNELTPTLTAFLQAHRAKATLTIDHQFGAPIYSCAVQDRDGNHSEADGCATADEAVNAAIDGYWQEVNRAAHERAAYLAEIESTYTTSRGV